MPRGIKTREQIAAVVSAAAPLPVNVICRAPAGLRSAQPGGGPRGAPAIARPVAAAFMRAAWRLLNTGTFNAFCRQAAASELNTFFRADAAARLESLRLAPLPLGAGPVALALA